MRGSMVEASSIPSHVGMVCVLLSLKRSGFSLLRRTYGRRLIIMLSTEDDSGTPIALILGVF